MNAFLIVIIIILCIAGTAAITFLIVNNKNNSGTTPLQTNQNYPPNTLGNSVQTNTIPEQQNLTINFNPIPPLTPYEESQMVEITDQNLLYRIDGIIPGTLQALANARAFNAFQSAPLYQAILPQGAILANSRDMGGAVRGFFHGTRGIQGQANFVAVNNNLATVNAVNAVMGVASMVVGQYYMTKINKQLDTVMYSLKGIADFLDAEYKSKIIAIVAEVQKYSCFQVAIIENNELRNRELLHLTNIEHECAQLLGQANIKLQNSIRDDIPDFETYELCVFEINKWKQYQHALLNIMYRVTELTYALNLGNLSKEYCNATYLPYLNQAKAVLEKLPYWHSNNISRFEVDTNLSRRKKQGLSAFMATVPGLINEDQNYKPISLEVTELIREQSTVTIEPVTNGGNDQYRTDVRLIAKSGKLYYLPSNLS